MHRGSMASRLLRQFVRRYSKKPGGFASSTGSDGGHMTRLGEDEAPRPAAGEGFDKSPFEIIKEQFDLKNIMASEEQVLPVPRETDILVVGGGAIGSSVAYWLKQRNPVGFSVTVVERDPCYTRAATVLSVGGIRQQFSLPENIKMSLFTADFIREIKEHLSVIGMDPPEIGYNPQGYLFLASEKGVETLQQNHETQIALGAKVKLMSPDQLKEKFPWLNTEGIVMGSYGYENEGWFDPWLLLNAFKAKAISLGAQYVKGEVVGFIHDEQMMRKGLTEEGQAVRKTCNTVQVRTDDGKLHNMKFSHMIDCAGPWAGEVASMLGVGNQDSQGVNRFPLPIQPRKRYVYVVHCHNGPGLECPLVIDPTGVYFRREGLGGLYLCGTSPQEGEQVQSSSQVELDDDSGEKHFHETVLPSLSHRVPVFTRCQLKSAWAGYYDYNYFDQNLIIGSHPYYNNVMFVGGCSGHGIQQAPAIGRAVMEYIIDDEFTTIDLSRLSFDRVILDQPVFEQNIV